jgi:hypothetical protein
VTEGVVDPGVTDEPFAPLEPSGCELSLLKPTHERKPF